MKYYSYENFKDDTNILIQNVRDFNPEVIIAIARGGLTLAHAMAEGLNIRDVQSIRTELYDGTQIRELITLFGTCELQDKKKVLIVDDIADSGQTLDAVIKHLEGLHSSIEFKSCTLFYKESSSIEPDYWLNDANDWINFFWESDFSEDL